MPIEFPDVMNVVVVDEVFSADILGARPIATEKNTRSSDMLDMVVGDLILLSV